MKTWITYKKKEKNNYWLDVFCLLSKDAVEQNLNQGISPLLMLPDSKEAKKKANIVSVFLIQTNFSLGFNSG